MWIDRRWLHVGLGLSGLLNLFFVGFLASHLYADRARAPERMGFLSESQLRALPDDERNRFIDAMAAHQSAIAAARTARLAVRHGLAAEIAAPTFDRAHVAAGFADLRRANTAVQEASHAAAVAALAALSPASRRTLVAPDLSGENEADGR
jgi:uncharacterized membrane protein